MSWLAGMAAVLQLNLLAMRVKAEDSDVKHGRHNKIAQNHFPLEERVKINVYAQLQPRASHEQGREIM